MLTRSLIVATTVLACIAVPLSGVEAESRNKPQNGHGATNRQISPGNGMMQMKQNTAQVKPKKRTRPALGPIIFTKHYDKASPY
jgi:type VI protein secretion system component Hcp